jgi:hypothetical protein
MLLERQVVIPAFSVFDIYLQDGNPCIALIIVAGWMRFCYRELHETEKALRVDAQSTGRVFPQDEPKGI